MVVQPSPHGDFHYKVVTRRRTGKERSHEFASEDPLEPGDVLRLDGRYWLITSIEPVEGGAARAIAEPGSYRLRLRHPDERVEVGGLRRIRPDAPRVGHSFTTIEDGHQVSWEVLDQQLERDDQGEPYLAFTAERDFAESEALPNHELEHTLARRRDEELPPSVEAAFSRAEQMGLSIELVALEPGEEPDWEEAERFIDALVLEEVADDLLELCGVDPDRDPQDSWLEQVKRRLRSDLAQFRADVEGDYEQIEQWSFRDGRIFASIGSPDDEADPLSGHGWMCRLLDAEVLGAAGFERVRKAEVEPA
ncbi:MAG TPA: hypothetical protein VFL41_03715 [Gaiellaceae bacterium]|nr:hypothetical protein [Gaiellaceae bacterium]